MKRYDPGSESGKPKKERQPTNSLTLKEAYRVLSSRECDVLELIGEGKSNREIAARLFISADTVESHITHISSKLGLKGWGALRKWAQSNAGS
jgi:DNA-binding NarL/FixJ family response regulator